MKYYQLNNGDRIPALGLGTWKSPTGEVYLAVQEALKIGYRHIDCAPIYRNEAEIGQAFTEAITSGAVKREDLWITSKLWSNAHQQERVIPAIKETLTDLRLDYLDLFLIHWPIVLRPEVLLPETGEDLRPLEEVPLEETWQGMQMALQEGLCRHIGVSNFNQKKLASLNQVSGPKPEVNQVESHPYLQQNDLLTYCRSEGILLTAYSPLGSKDRPEMLKKPDEPSLLDHPLVQKIAAQYHLTPAQLLIAWGINRGTVVIPKSVNSARLKENFAAAEIVLDTEAMEEIAALERGYRFVDGSFWERPGSPYTMANLWND
ncbi:aldo/keto reductase [Gloeocapsa sp. PCC 73106]|uniref:aldo/keto reductase n=1 Tax=Gloeocapsa sp. PCC 73106 TaxID=102232 RepID=UPI0002ACCC7D|nr:aldo/keto reductase [Gloeocapsa sp. PCC 73106]ELR99144.1 aldo/keto reductase, diketogulonate reductase [Gloeocapsa sp. PCC 73106]